MSNTEIYLIFIIAAFTLAAVVLLKKDAIEPRIRRFLAIFTLIMVLSAFFLILYIFLHGVS